MKEFRKRFVQMNMLLIGIILFAMMAVIAVYMNHDYRKNLRITLEQVVEPLDSFPMPPESGTSPDRQTTAERLQEPERDGADDTRPQPPEHEDADEKRPQGIMTVFYANKTQEYAILSQETLFDESELPGILEEVICAEQAFGMLRDHSAYFYHSGNDTLSKIAFASADSVRYSMLRLLLALAAVWIAAMLCLLMISIRLSAIAVRPMEEAMRREKQFVADASHDLKTPLAVILANCSILRENPQATAESLGRWIDSTHTAADNMRGLIEEMLTLSETERTDVPLAVHPADAAAIVTKAVLQLESVAYEKGIMLDTDLPDTLRIATNEDYLLRIAGSLLENAVKYEPAGGRVTVTLTDTGREVRLGVRNHGTEISPEDLPHIFERFYRADKSRGNASGGHGLGLSITKQMTERLGGSITVTSEPENGTAFTVSLKR